MSCLLSCIRCVRSRLLFLLFGAALFCAGFTGPAVFSRAASSSAAPANGPSVGLTPGSVALPVRPQATVDAPRFSEESSLVSHVLDLENERLSLMPSVAAWKWQHHAPTSDPPRERIVILAAGKLAQLLGLAPAPIERLFALQVRLARDAETGRVRHWRTSGYDFTGRPPDLKNELRPHLDRLTSDLLRALYLAAPAFARPRFTELYAARSTRLLKNAAWSPASRRELLADLAAVRLEPATPGGTPGPASVLERIDDSHFLRIGTTGDYAPFSAEAHGRLRGVDIELAQALAQKLGARPIFVRTSWPTLLDDLRHDRFDVAIGGISATPAREAAAAMSIPYLSGGKTLIARCRDARRFDSLAAVDRPGVRVIVNPGGTNEQYVRAHLRRARVIAYPSNASIFEQLVAGRADVMITDDVEVALQTRRHPQLCRALPGTLTRADKVILMLRDPALVAAVDGWLHHELANGAPARLLEEALAQ
jgi:cyclohexadienyl dehydratase